ncbi:MAG: hypothetical protein ACYCSB_04235 [bacterium]
MNIIIEGVNVYEEDIKEYGTYSVPQSLEMKISFIPTLEKVKKLWDKHAKHGDCVYTRLKKYMLVSDDGKVCHLYFDGNKVWDINNLPEDVCRQIIADNEKISAIRSEASYELGWDNFDTARSLHSKADDLESLNFIAKSALSLMNLRQMTA